MVTMESVDDTYLNPPKYSKSAKHTIDVAVSITLSKTMQIEVDDYEIYETDNSITYDYSGCDLHKAVEDQRHLPSDLASITEVIFKSDLDLKAIGMPLYLKSAINDCKDWNVDDLQVILDE